MNDDENITVLDPARLTSTMTDDSNYDDIIDDLKTYFEKLIYKMSLTKGARYQAAQRHSRRAQSSMWAIIFLSLYVFTSNVIIIALPDSIKNLNSLLSIMSIVMSAFIIVFSVLESSYKHDLQSELFLRNAQKISDLHDNADYEYKTNIYDRQVIELIRKKYSELTNRFPYNHLEIDFQEFRASSMKKKYSTPSRYLIHAKYYFSSYGIMWMSLTTPPLALWILWHQTTS